MANLGSYYINGPTLATATAVYTDVDLVYCAPDGFYSDGSIVRQQISCVLQPAQSCDVCDYPCPITPAVPAPAAQQAAYSMLVDVGAGTGAIVINFTPGGPPNGIKAEYDGVTYNNLSSPDDGFHSASGTTAITYLGRVADDVICGGIAGTSPVLDSYRYNGATFVATGGNTAVTIDVTDVSLNAGPALPGTCVMVIPKLNATPTTLTLTMIAPCALSLMSVEVECPAALTLFQGRYHGPGPPGPGACGDPLDKDFYNAPVTGAAGAPAFYDWIFTDPNGEFPLAGVKWIEIAGSNWMRVENGVVVDFQACIP